LPGFRREALLRLLAKTGHRHGSGYRRECFSGCYCNLRAVISWSGIKDATAPGELEKLGRIGTVVGIGLDAGPVSQRLYRQIIKAGFDPV
jgi:hypothetical protein